MNQRAIDLVGALCAQLVALGPDVRELSVTVAPPWTLVEAIVTTDAAVCRLAQELGLEREQKLKRGRGWVYRVASIRDGLKIEVEGPPHDGMPPFGKRLRPPVPPAASAPSAPPPPGTASARRTPGR